MDDHRKTSLEQITALFDSQQLAVLSTQKNDQPYASLVAFAASEDLEQILFLNPQHHAKIRPSDNQPPKLPSWLTTAGTRRKIFTMPYL